MEECRHSVWPLIRTAETHTPICISSFSDLRLFSQSLPFACPGVFPSADEEAEDADEAKINYTTTLHYYRQQVAGSG